MYKFNPTLLSEAELPKLDIKDKAMGVGNSFGAPDPNARKPVEYTGGWVVVDNHMLGDVQLKIRGQIESSPQYQQVAQAALAAQRERQELAADLYGTATASDEFKLAHQEMEQAEKEMNAARVSDAFTPDLWRQARQRAADAAAKVQGIVNKFITSDPQYQQANQAFLAAKKQKESLDAQIKAVLSSADRVQEAIVGGPYQTMDEAQKQMEQLNGGEHGYVNPVDPRDKDTFHFSVMEMTKEGKLTHATKAQKPYSQRDLNLADARGAQLKLWAAGKIESIEDKNPDPNYLEKMRARGQKPGYEFLKNVKCPLLLDKMNPPRTPWTVDEVIHAMRPVMLRIVQNRFMTTPQKSANVAEAMSLMAETIASRLATDQGRAPTFYYLRRGMDGAVKTQGANSGIIKKPRQTWAGAKSMAASLDKQVGEEDDATLGDMTTGKSPRIRRFKCPSCHGKGRIILGSCNACNGTGRQGAGPCPVCKGTSKVYDECPTCRGVGAFAYDDPVESDDPLAIIGDSERKERAKHLVDMVFRAAGLTDHQAKIIRLSWGLDDGLMGGDGNMKTPTEIAEILKTTGATAANGGKATGTAVGVRKGIEAGYSKLAKLFSKWKSSPETEALYDAWVSFQETYGLPDLGAFEEDPTTMNVASKKDAEHAMSQALGKDKAPDKWAPTLGTRNKRKFQDLSPQPEGKPSADADQALRQLNPAKYGQNHTGKYQTVRDLQKWLADNPQSINNITGTFGDPEWGYADRQMVEPGDDYMSDVPRVDYDGDPEKIAAQLANADWTDEQIDEPSTGEILGGAGATAEIPGGVRRPFSPNGGGASPRPEPGELTWGSAAKGQTYDPQSGEMVTGKRYPMDTFRRTKIRPRGEEPVAGDLSALGAGRDPIRVTPDDLTRKNLPLTVRGIRGWNYYPEEPLDLGDYGIEDGSDKDFEKQTADNLYGSGRLAGPPQRRWYYVNDQGLPVDAEGNPIPLDAQGNPMSHVVKGGKRVPAQPLEAPRPHVVECLLREAICFMEELHFKSMTNWVDKGEVSPIILEQFIA